jgi:NapH/MauN family ferredoxin-type protein
MRVRKKITALTYVRWAILFSFLAFMFYTSYMHTVIAAEGFGTVDSLCPFGGVESFYKWISQGGYISKIAPSAMVLMVATLIMALVTRRAFCGWLCPLGGIQEWAGALGRKLMKNRTLRMPASLDRILRYAKYVLLAAIVYFTWTTGELVWRSNDPWAALMHVFQTSEFWETFAVGAALLVVSVVGSFFYDRFFCKYMCPLGAVLAVASVPGVLAVKRDKDTCINCHICTNVCPMNVDVEAATNVTSSECINCLQCVENCPVKGTLTVGSIYEKPTAKTKKAVSVWLPAILTLAVFFGSYGVSVVAGTWKTTGGRLVVDSAPAVTATGEVKYPPVEDIKGSNSLEDVLKVYNITKAELYTACSIPESVPESTKIKDVAAAAKMSSFEPDQVRTVVTKILAARGIK